MSQNYLRKSELTAEDRLFLNIIHDCDLREALLARLQEIELLDAFLQAESETI